MFQKMLHTISIVSYGTALALFLLLTSQPLQAQGDVFSTGDIPQPVGGGPCEDTSRYDRIYGTSPVRLRLEDLGKRIAGRYFGEVYPRCAVMFVQRGRPRSVGPTAICSRRILNSMAGATCAAIRRPIPATNPPATTSQATIAPLPHLRHNQRPIVFLSRVRRSCFMTLMDSGARNLPGEDCRIVRPSGAGQLTTSSLPGTNAGMKRFSTTSKITTPLLSMTGRKLSYSGWPMNSVITSRNCLVQPMRKCWRN